MAARSSSCSSDDVLSEGSDSNALNLYDSDGDNSEPLGESGPRPYQYELRRVHRNDPHEDNTEPVDSDADRLVNTDWVSQRKQQAGLAKILYEDFFRQIFVSPTLAVDVQGIFNQLNSRSHCIPTSTNSFLILVSVSGKGSNRSMPFLGSSLAPEQLVSP
ncbi:uncharacterized protein LOC111335501 [Stylophora pistillata]|uniref:uncharacterized protein LOC111335501 n=1 Tax=Stylophora pistillata TaxID=50429 RepID=UPI000C048B8D|nr:uncharacterized protein LOC111335501 [Stylophora pistillata]